MVRAPQTRAKPPGGCACDLRGWGSEGRRPAINEVLDAIATHFELTREQLLSERARVPFRARRIALYFAYRVTQRCLSQIGTASCTLSC